ncbi:MAG: ABC transporter permease [Bacillota bacterium]|jgi:oligopeptide transport system permease protein
MVRYVLNRLLLSIVIIFTIATLTFWLSRAIPGGPFSRWERPLPPKVIENLERKYNLNLPIWQQYLRYMANVACFDFGVSFTQTETVNEIIAQRFPVSFQIGSCAFLVAIGLGIPLGIASALKELSLVDNLVKILTTLFISIPSFVIAAVMMYFFGIYLGILPVAMWGTWRHAVMPVMALAASPMAVIIKYTRASMLEVADADYIRTAKAKGASPFIVTYKHCLKNALLPILTVAGPMFVSITVGSFVIEQLFGLPGLGQMFTKAILGRDYSMIMGLTIFYAILLIGMTLLVDILYGFVDPRIRISKETTL